MPTFSCADPNPANNKVLTFPALLVLNPTLDLSPYYWDSHFKAYRINNVEFYRL
jgi:hypothetical protein